jgi:hypothetical protein
MRNTSLNRLLTGLLLGLTLLVSVPVQANHTYPDPPNKSRKETRREARLLKRKGQRLELKGKEMVKEGRALREDGSRRQARNLRKEGRVLRRSGKELQKQSRLLRKGKISSRVVRTDNHCRGGNRY